MNIEIIMQQKMFIVGLVLWPSLLSEVLIKAYVSPSLSNVHNFQALCVSTIKVKVYELRTKVHVI